MTTGAHLPPIPFLVSQAEVRGGAEGVQRLLTAGIANAYRGQ